jgi:hypothetical protein
MAQWCDSYPGRQPDQRGYTQVKTGTQTRLLLIHGGLLDRSTANVEVITDAKSSFSDAFKFDSAKPRHNAAPLANRGGADLQRPRDIRGSLKVINNVLLEHGPSLTAFNYIVQPHLKGSPLTSVHMDKYATLADRLKDAMGQDISASDLSRACDVSPAAVSKWLDGTTKKLSAENYASAARALGVRDEWLRTGRLPREREGGNTERDMDRVMDLLEGLQGPLAQLAGAIQQLTKDRSEATRKRHRP